MSHVQDASAALDGHYQLHFAGRPRASRDLAMLDAMLASPGLAPTDPRRQAWRREREAIGQAQAQLTEQGVALARTLERLALAHARVRRQAALVATTDWTDAEAAALERELAAARREAVALALPAFLTPILGPERTRLIAALSEASRHVSAWREASRTAGLGEARQEPRARVLVQRAGRLLARFSGQVSGRLQPTVRPELLATLADGLAEVAAELAPLTVPDVGAEPHAANCRALVAQAAHWRAQAHEGTQLRRQQAAAELVTLLLDEADAVLAAAEGIEPTAADRRLSLAHLCARMDEAFRQLDDLPTAFGLGTHAQATLGIVDCLQFLDARLDEALGAAAGAAPAPGQP